jgi:hypothetical protein
MKIDSIMENILNKSRAKAVYDAMCALNDIGAVLEARIPMSDARFPEIFVKECFEGTITIELRAAGGGALREIYENQNRFAAAYAHYLNT